MKPIPEGATPIRETIEYGIVPFYTFATFTDKGGRIEVGVAVKATQPAYWCHAHSSLSYHLYGYCVPAVSLVRVLEDEYEAVAKKPVCGDTVAWWENEVVKHSARIERATHNLGGSSTDIIVSNKPGLALSLDLQEADRRDPRVEEDEGTRRRRGGEEVALVGARRRRSSIWGRWSCSRRAPQRPYPQRAGLDVE